MTISGLHRLMSSGMGLHQAAIAMTTFTTRSVSLAARRARGQQLGRAQLGHCFAI